MDPNRPTTVQYGVISGGSDEATPLAWNNSFGDMGFPDAERAYGAVLRHAKRACCWWIPGALKCFKGAGEPHRTPALMAGFNAVPCASAARRPAGSLLSWNNSFGDIGFPDAESGHTVRSSGTLSGISLFDSTGCSTHRPRNQLRGVAACRSGASARAAPDRWRPLKVPEDRTVRPLSLLESMLFPARQRPGQELAGPIPIGGLRGLRGGRPQLPRQVGDGLSQLQCRLPSRLGVVVCAGVQDRAGRVDHNTLST